MPRTHRDGPAPPSLSEQDGRTRRPSCISGNGWARRERRHVKQIARVVETMRA
jgi:hypothetical protein